MDKPEVQRQGEAAAAAYYERRGLRVLARNWRLRMGEIDLVVMDGDTLVFAEVKTRSSRDLAEPELSVGYSKQRRLKRLADAYIDFERPSFAGCRFDVIAVILNGSHLTLRHIPDAFW